RVVRSQRRSERIVRLQVQVADAEAAAGATPAALERRCRGYAVEDATPHLPGRPTAHHTVHAIQRNHDLHPLPQAGPDDPPPPRRGGSRAGLPGNSRASREQREGQAACVGSKTARTDANWAVLRRVLIFPTTFRSSFAVVAGKLQRSTR